MPRHAFDTNDELVKARQRRDQQENGPRADGSGGDSTTLLSALGNARVQRLMRSAALHRQADGSGSVDDAVAQTIQAKRGSGQTLDESARRSLEPAFGEDFSDVRVHTDSESDSLNQAVHAEAFTTGKDIFFRDGSYNPGSSDGQKLLAHELTHVVQQRSAPPASELTVSDPEDASEREAGDVADSFSSNAAPAGVSRQEVPEEEEIEMSPISRQPEEEEVPMGGQAPEQSESSFPALGEGQTAEQSTPEEMQGPAQEGSLPALGNGETAPGEQTPAQEEEELVAGSFINRQEQTEHEYAQG